MAAQGESGSDLFLCKLDFLLVHSQMLLWKEFFRFGGKQQNYYWGGAEASWVENRDE